MQAMLRVAQMPAADILQVCVPPVLHQPVPVCICCPCCCPGQVRKNLALLREELNMRAGRMLEAWIAGQCRASAAAAAA